MDSHTYLFLFLADSLFAKEDDRFLEHETHGVKFESLLHLAEILVHVEPLDAAVVNQLARLQIHFLFVILQHPKEKGLRKTFKAIIMNK